MSAALLFAACGSSAKPGKDSGADAQGSGDSATGDLATSDAATDTPPDGGSDVAPDVTDATPGGDRPACEGAGSTCTTNPGAPCVLGRVACGDAGPTCVDGLAASDGTTCTGGACVTGVCAPAATLATDADLSKDSLTLGRTCAEGIQYAVTALTANTATLAATSFGDCLAAGDEILLLDAQGTPTDNAKVGTWELLTLAAVDGAAKAVTFATNKTRDYGTPAAPAGADGGGTDAGGVDAAADGGSKGGAVSSAQKLVLARVPHFGDLTIAAGKTLTSAAWDGTTGGVLALRASTVQVDGTISASSLGYRAGRWSQDALNCVDNVTTEAGESIAGTGTASTMRNFGGSGGIAAATGISFIGSSPMVATPGHAHDGEAGVNPNGRTLGEPGAAYGVADGTRLTMGSGPGGNLTCDTNASAPHLIDYKVNAGGIVALFAGKITVSATGAVTASPPPVPRDIAYAGGYVLLRGATIDVGTDRVTAKGSTTVPGTASQAANVNHASDGYIVVDVTGPVAGTTDPVAHFITH